MAWATSTRAARLPPDWPAIRARVLRRDHHRCQAHTHAPGCDRVATDVDHIIAGDDHSMSNLQALSAACHRAKTARESAERNKARAAMRRRRDPHPGALTTAPTESKATQRSLDLRGGGG